MYTTETHQASSQFVNQSFINKIESGNIKEAEEQGSAFIRSVVRQEAAVRMILPPVELTASELDRDEEDDAPKKIVEKEPDSEATFVQFNGTPSARWFKSDRYAVYIGTMISDEFVKNKFELMSSQNDIRKILADNSTKDVADQEDKRFRKTCSIIVNRNPTVQITPAAAFTTTVINKALKALWSRRRPVGKLLMTKSRFADAVDLPATAVGNAIAEGHYREGIENEEKFLGIPVVSTIKSHIYSDDEVWAFSPQNFLGNFFLLQDTTLYIEQKGPRISFFTYNAPGIGIGNNLSMQLIRFS